MCVAWHLFCPSTDDERDQFFTPWKTLKITTNMVQVIICSIRPSTKYPGVEPLSIIKKKKKMPLPPIWRCLITADQTAITCAYRSGQAV